MAQDQYGKDEGTGNEYQFKDEQEPGEYKYEEPSSVPSMKQKRRPIVTIISILVAIFIAYEIIHLMFVGKPKTTDDVTMTKVSVQDQQPAVQKPQPFNANVASVATGPAQPTDADLSVKLDKIDADTQTLIGNMDKQQFQTQSNMLSLQQSLTDVSGKLDQIAQSLEVIAAQETAQQAHMRQESMAKARQARAVRQIKRYFVSAVIPGRAWLKGADGSTLTVVVGQQLQGYGRVTLIDPYSGVVRTTAGPIPYGTSSN